MDINLNYYQEQIHIPVSCFDPERQRHDETTRVRARVGTKVAPNTIGGDPAASEFTTSKRIIPRHIRQSGQRLKDGGRDTSIEEPIKRAVRVSPTGVAEVPAFHCTAKRGRKSSRRVTGVQRGSTRSCSNCQNRISAPAGHWRASPIGTWEAKHSQRWRQQRVWPIAGPSSG